MMASNAKEPALAWQYLHYTALIPIFIGVLCLIGWYQHIEGLVQLAANISPMQYNTGLATILSGLSILFFYKIPLFSKVSGFLAFLLAFIILVEYIFDVNFGIDQLFIKPFINTNTAFSGRMAPNTALCISLIGAMLFFQPSPTRLTLAKIFLSINIFIFLLTITALLGYLINFSIAYGWSNWAQMAPQTALSINILSLALASIYWNKYQLTATIKNYLVSIIVCIGSVIILVLWQFLVQNEYKANQSLVKNSTNYIKNSLLVEITGYYDSIDRMEKRILTKSYSNIERWKEDCSNYFKDMPALLEIAFFKPTKNGPVVSFFPPALQLGFTDTNILEKCLGQNQTPASAYQEYLCLKSPVIYKNKALIFATLIDMKMLIDTFSRTFQLEDYGLEIHYNNKLLYKKDNPSLHFAWDWNISTQISVHNLVFNVLIWPYKNLEKQHETWFPTLSLIVGLCFVSLLGLVMYLLQLEKENAEKTEASEQKFRSVLNNAADAILIVDAKGKVTLANRSALQLFEYTEDEILTKQVEDLMPQRFKDRHQEYRNEYLRLPTSRSMGSVGTLSIKTKHGQEIPVEIGLNPLNINQELFTLCSIHNMSMAKLSENKLKEKTNLLQMLLDIANSITNNESYEQTLQHCLAIICTAINWPIGHIYTREEDKEELHPSNIWYIQDEGLDGFRKITMESVFLYGQLLPGKILSTAVPILINDIGEERNFFRKKVCETLKLTSAFAFPIKVNGKIKAVAEFFSHQKVEDSAGLLLIGNVLSGQIGRFIEYQNILEQKDVLANRFKFAVGSGKIGIWDFDISTNLLIWDKQMYQLYGIDPQIQVNYNHWANALHPEDAEYAKTALSDAISGGPPFDTEFRIVTPNKEIRYIRAHAIVRFSTDGVAKTVLGLNWDITKEKMLFLKLQQKTKELEDLNMVLEKQAYYDPLTDLMNRRSFTDAGNRLLERGMRNHLLLGFFFIDLDYFKKINDEFGHPVGDKLLIEISKKLVTMFRKEDLIGRLGGDEFAVIVELKSIENAVHLGKKIIENLHQPITIDTHTFEMDTSVGAAIYPNHGNDFKDLMQKADNALLRAKKNGRNRVEIYPE